MRSPSSASAISTVRSRSVGIRRVSTSPIARASTKAGRPASCPASARNPPGPSSTIGTMWLRPSRALTATEPERMTDMPALIWPVVTSASPAA